MVEFVLPGDNVLPRDDVSLDSGFSDEEVEDMEGRIFMKNFSFLVWLDRGKTLGKFPRAYSFLSKGVLPKRIAIYLTIWAKTLPTDCQTSSSS